MLHDGEAQIAIHYYMGMPAEEAASSRRWASSRACSSSPARRTSARRSARSRGRRAAHAARHALDCAVARADRVTNDRIRRRAEQQHARLADEEQRAGDHDRRAERARARDAPRQIRRGLDGGARSRRERRGERLGIHRALLLVARRDHRASTRARAPRRSRATSLSARHRDHEHRAHAALAQRRRERARAVRVVRAVEDARSPATLEAARDARRARARRARVARATPSVVERGERGGGVARADARPAARPAARARSRVVDRRSRSRDAAPRARLDEQRHRLGLARRADHDALPALEDAGLLARDRRRACRRGSPRDRARRR